MITGLLHKGYELTPTAADASVYSVGGAVAAQRLCHDRRLSSSLVLLHEDDAFQIQNRSEGKGLSSQMCQLCIATPSVLREGKKERGW